MQIQSNLFNPNNRLKGFKIHNEYIIGWSGQDRKSVFVTKMEEQSNFVKLDI